MNTEKENWIDPADAASAINDTDSGSDDHKVISPALKQSQSSLRSEAVADFKALNGYWNQIIVRSMVASKDALLPDVLIV